MADGSVLDHPIISERYFFPRRAPLQDPFVVAAGDCELHCSLHRAAIGAPLLLHFHGNGEVVSDWLGEWPEALAAAGISTLFAEYRGYGGSSGQPMLGAMLEDAVLIANASGSQPSRTVAYGRSVGSIYALHAARTLGLAGLVIESGIADVRERLLLRLRPGELGATPEELDAAIAASLDHKAKLAGYAAPVLVFHAEGDHLVPAVHGERLADWSTNGALRRFAQGDHNSIHAYNGEEIVAETAEFVRRCT